MRLERFGKEWRESKIPADLRQLGVLGSTTEIHGTDFTMTMQAMQRSPNFVLHGFVNAAGGVESQVTAHLELSAFNRAVGAIGVVVVALLIGRSNGLLAGLVSGGAIAGVVVGMTALGRSLAESRFRQLLECALADLGAVPSNTR
jgi:hypothetical protein